MPYISLGLFLQGEQVTLDFLAQGKTVYKSLLWRRVELPGLRAGLATTKPPE